MPRKAKTLTLTVEERQQLETLVERGRDWQERRRAQTVLLLDKGLSPSKVSALHKVHPDTVANHRDAWLARGFEGLRDLPRCGAPPQLSVALAQAVCGWAREGAHTAPELQSRLAAEHGVQVSVWVVRSALADGGFLWKRTRHNLKKAQRDRVPCCPGSHRRAG